MPLRRTAVNEFSVVGTGWDLVDNADGLQKHPRVMHHVNYHFTKSRKPCQQSFVLGLEYALLAAETVYHQSVQLLRPANQREETVLCEVLRMKSTLHNSLGNEVHRFRNQLRRESAHLSIHGPELSILGAYRHRVEVQSFSYHTSVR
jgi:hypothetical protein